MFRQLRHNRDRSAVSRGCHTDAAATWSMLSAGIQQAMGKGLCRDSYSNIVVAGPETHSETSSASSLGREDSTVCSSRRLSAWPNTAWYSERFRMTASPGSASMAWEGSEGPSTPNVAAAHFGSATC